MIKIFLILFLSIFYLKADEIILDNFSYHISEKNDYNNFNPGIGYKYDLKNDYSILGGYYYNSYRKDTFYIAVEKLFPLNESLKIGGIFGLLTGYPYEVYKNIDVIPAIGAEVEIKLLENLKLNTLISTTEFLPEKYMKTTVLHFQFRFPLNY
jgi:hypothetical protein